MSLADKAKEAVNGSRQENYGHPYDNFRLIARLWGAYLNLSPETISPEDVAQMMILLKMARLKNTPDHEDSLVDEIGYVNCHEMIVEHRKLIGR